MRLLFAERCSRFSVALAVALVAFLSGCGGGGDSAPPPSVTVMPTSPAAVSISGTATPAAGMVADSDVNDPQAPFATNDTPTTAQLVSGLASISGFASAIGSGPAGSRFALVADKFDAYRSTLAAGQAITLSVASWNAAAPLAIDLDLFLYSASPVNLVASSEGIGSSEALIVPASGEYFILVMGFTGASTYELNLGANTAAVASATDRLSRLDDFVEDEIVVLFKKESIRSKSSALLNQLAAHGLPAAGALDRPMLIKRDRASALSGASSAPMIDAWTGQPLDDLTARRAETIRSVKALRGSADVSAASPNYRSYASAVPNDQYYRFQWHYPLINLPQAWDITTGVRAGNPVIVAVVDTGVWLAHADLQGQLVSGYDFIRDAARALDGDGIDADPNDPGDLGLGVASSWHGTHVAGTVAAATNNSIGVAGVASGAKVMPIRVLGRFLGGTSYDVNQGIRYAAGLANDSGTIPPQKADIINLSLGGPSPDPVTEATIAEARAAGVIVIAAAGNETTSAPKYPASYPGVVSVSAVDMNRALAPYSNFGSNIDVAAPGGNSAVDLDLNAIKDGVVSTLVDEPGGNKQSSYEQYQGTSMAAPHVAGVAALMRAIAPAMTPSQFDTLLASGALTDDLGAAGRDDQYGYGLINAIKAVAAAQDLATSGTIPPVLVTTPTALNFGSATNQLTLRLANGGAGSLSIISIGDDASWLSGAAQSVDANGLGDWIVTVDRTGLSDGLYSATITVTSDVGATNVPVSMSVQTTSALADAGHLYFLLIDPVTLTPVRQAQANASGGNYSFALNNVASGNYFLVAGSDLDNDGFICGPGEACGAWPTLSSPEQINATTSVSGLNFAIVPNSSLVATQAGSTSLTNRGYRRLQVSPVKEVR